MHEECREPFSLPGNRQRLLPGKTIFLRSFKKGRRIVKQKAMYSYLWNPTLNFENETVPSNF